MDERRVHGIGCFFLCAALAFACFLWFQSNLNAYREELDVIDPAKCYTQVYATSVSISNDHGSISILWSVEEVDRPAYKCSTIGAPFDGKVDARFLFVNDNRTRCQLYQDERPHADMSQVVLSFLFFCSLSCAGVCAVGEFVMVCCRSKSCCPSPWKRVHGKEEPVLQSSTAIEMV
jgi:hypothetical protein